MYPPIVCPSCGFSLGDLYDSYMSQIEKRARESGKDINLSDSEMEINGTEVLNFDVEDILDNLGINKICCRMHMITNVEFRKLV